MTRAAPGVRVRPGRAGDRDRLRALQATTLSAPAPELLDAALGPGGPAVLVLDRGGTVAGYALAVAGDREADPSVVYLAELAVAPGLRRRGHGSALLSAVCARHAGYDQLRLAARADDDRALAFYRASGFRELSRLERYFETEPPSGEDGAAVSGDAGTPAGGAVDGLLLARPLAAGDGSDGRESKDGTDERRATGDGTTGAAVGEQAEAGTDGDGA